MDAKFQFVIGGWATSDGKRQPGVWDGWHHGFGTQAAVRSPSSSLVTIAGYNGGFDAGEAAAQVNDEGFFKSLCFTMQNAQPRASYMQAVRSNLSLYNRTCIDDGPYEAGPGYNMNSLNRAAPEFLHLHS